MTVTLELAPEDEMQLREKSIQRGQPAEDYLLTALRHEFERDQPITTPIEEQKPPQSLAETLKGRTGLFSSGGARMSENTGAKFAEGMAEKRRQGRL